jgi:hypothetical protein
MPRPLGTSTAKPNPISSENGEDKIVPAYYYQCTHCQATECRIGGVDDHLAVCAHCQNLMLRLDYDLFSPYFEASASTAMPPAPRSWGQESRKKPVRQR